MSFESRMQTIMEHGFYQIDRAVARVIFKHEGPDAHVDELGAYDVKTNTIILRKRRIGIPQGLVLEFKR